MKKKLSILTALLLCLILVLSACAGGDNNNSGSNNNANNGGNTPSNAQSGNTSTPDPTQPANSGDKTPSGGGKLDFAAGQEFTSYCNYYEGLYGKYESLITEDERNYVDTDFTGAVTKFQSVMMNFLALLDLDGIADGTNRMTKAPLDATKTTSGKEIKITVDSEYQEDYGLALKGDKSDMTVILDMDKSTLNYDKKDAYSLDDVTRKVFEIAMLPNGGLLIQIFNVKNGTFFGEVEFIHIDGDSYTLVCARTDSNVDFTYDSIIGKGDTDPEKLAEGYTVKDILNVENGKVSYEHK